MSVYDLDKIKEIIEAIEEVLNMSSELVPKLNLVRFQDRNGTFRIVYEYNNRRVKIFREDYDENYNYIGIYYKADLKDIVQFRYLPGERVMFLSLVNGVYAFVMLDKMATLYTKINMTLADWQERDWLMQDKGI